MPPEHEAHFTETIWRLPQTRMCFTAPEDDLPVAPLPEADFPTIQVSAQLPGARFTYVSPVSGGPRGAKTGKCAILPTISQHALSNGA